MFRNVWVVKQHPNWTARQKYALAGIEAIELADEEKGRPAGWLGRPQGLSLNSVAYCCKIITPGPVSVLTMQATFVELMTTQLRPPPPLPNRKEPVPAAVVSQL